MHVLILLFISLIISFLGGKVLSTDQIRGFLTISLQLKEILIFILPAIILSFIANALFQLKYQATWLFFALLCLSSLSNAIAAFFAYGLGSLALPFLSHLSTPISHVEYQELTPYEYFLLPSWLGSDKAMIVGFAIGFVLKLKPWQPLILVLSLLKDCLTWFLQKIFIPVLPLYVFGFALEIQYEGIIQNIFKYYTQIFVFLLSSVMAYLIFLYGLSQGFRPKAWLRSIKNMLPAGITGFATMSSAATMPVTIAATKKNIPDPNFAELVIPSTVNNHLIGDAISVPFTALALITFSGASWPDFTTYACFVVYFCLAKFSTAAIPGGGIIVMLPVLETYLGLSHEMSGLMTVLYILQDPMFTSANVMGNGALALIYYRLVSKKFTN